MSITYASERNIASKNIPDPYMPVGTPVPYVRPADWLALPTVSTTDQKFVGLLAVLDNDSNFIALLANATGGYTVDWGDGSSPVTFASGAVAQYKYNYATISSGTISTRGYKQVIVTVTATSGNLSGINLQQKYVNTPVLVQPPSNWLDITVGSPFLNSLTVSGGAGNTVNLPLLEQFTWMSKLSTFAGGGQLFRNCWNLQNVVFDSGITGLSSFSFMFGQCSSLKNAPVINTSAGTDFSGMFNLCYNLTYLPLYNFINATNFTSMFQGCSALTSLPTFNTSNVTVFDRAFDGCRSLVNFPFIDTSKATNFNSMVSSCSSLTTFPLVNTSNVTNFTGMFIGCSRLTTIPLLNTTKATTTAQMFNSCSALESIPIIDTSNVLTTLQMFSNCTSLSSVPLLNTSKVTNAFGMFSNCVSMRTSPVFNTANVVNAASMFNTCSSLIEAPNISLVKATNISSMYNLCAALSGDITITIPTGSFTNAAVFLASANAVSSLTINTSGTATVTDLASIAGPAKSIRTLNLGNCTTATGAGSAFTNANSLSSLRVVGLGVSFNVASCMLDKAALETVFEDIRNNTSVQTVTITSNPGATTVTTRTGSGTTAGSNVITMSTTAGLTVGQYVYGTGVNTGIPVTFNNTANTVAYTNGGGLNGLNDGDNVMFTSVAGPVGVVINTRYWVVNRTTTTFQVASSFGGSAIDITNNNTGVMSIGGPTVSNQVITVNAGNCIISGVCGITNASVTLTTRSLNINQAVTKNWTVSG